MKLTFYSGGYTEPLATGNGTYYGKSEGIVRHVWDSESNTVENQTFSGIVNPSWVQLHPNGKVLYCVNESAKGGVRSFAVGQDGLVPMERVSSMGSCPCQLAVSPDGRLLVVCNYMSGNAAFFSLTPEGNIGALLQNIAFSGSGNRPDRQEGPHTHSAVFADDGYCYLCELGCDKLYRVETDKLFLGQAKAEQVYDFSKNGGVTGVRMGVFSPDGRFYFAAGELDNRIHCFACGKYWVHLGSLRADRTEGENYLAQISLHPSGKWLYASVRGEDDIVCFALEDGVLYAPRWFGCGGKTPRHFSLTDSHLICSNQHGNCITVFEIAPDGGLMQKAELPSPSVTVTAVVDDK